ncbi:MAG: ABC transporter ATP-binding protein [bacterium]
MNDFKNNNGGGGGGDIVIKLEHLGMIYKTGSINYEALKDINLTIYKGEFFSIMGASGSGKSTLMNILGCLDKPTSGKYFLEDMDVSKLNKDQLADIRNKKIGFVFQGFNLIQRLSVIENVELPLFYAGIPHKEADKEAKDALRLVDIAENKENNFPNQISGGEQQRVAIARAIVHNASIIMADEPTGNLDSVRSSELMSFFKKINEERSVTIILVTHEANVAAFAKKHIIVKDGHIVNG